MSSRRRRHHTPSETSDAAYRLLITYPGRDPKPFDTTDKAQARSVARKRSEDGAYVEFQVSNGWGQYETTHTYEPTCTRLRDAESEVDGCRTPWKRTYPTRAAAEYQATADGVRYGTTLHTYRCGRTDLHWHTTRDDNGRIPAGQTATPEDTARVRALDATAFSALVDADTKNTAPLPDRLGLRHPDNLTRWRWTLKALRSDLHQQLAARAEDTTPVGVDWRYRAERFLEALTLRIAECQTLRAQAAHQRAAA